MISKRIADVILESKGCAFVGQESELETAEPEALCCDGRATHIHLRTLIAQKLQNVQVPSRQLKVVL